MTAGASLVAALGLLAAGPLGPVPAPPFPAVHAHTVEHEFVAPGVERAAMRFVTAAGPVRVSAILIDPKEPTVRLGTVLANDRIVSADETVSSMAARTGAIAGINGDYFDIGATGSPLGVLVRDGALVRSPSSRVALTVARDRSLRIESYRLAGTATSVAGAIPLTGINAWPPQGGATLLGPEFGAVPATEGISVATLVPLQRTGPAPNGRYRVVGVETGLFAQSSTWRLGLGPGALASGVPLPQAGDEFQIDVATDPALGDVAAAVGGGPALLADGAPVDDPSSPNYAERDRRIPASAAALLADGRLALIVVDGRRPQTSIGVNRAELIGFLRGLGARDAMLFDSGGSATLVGRVLGESRATVLNEPSDGVERPVADGLFVYSDAPAGPAARLVVRPSSIVALEGAAVPLRARLVDAAGHALGDAVGPWRLRADPLATIEGDVLHAGMHPGATTLRIVRGGVNADVPLEVVDRVAHLTIGPGRLNPDPRGVAHLTAEATDARGRAVEVGGKVRWHADRAAIDAAGDLFAQGEDTHVIAEAGGATATTLIPVGRHEIPFPGFAPEHRAAWKFGTSPANGPGGLTFDGGTFRLTYDFTQGERAAYARAPIAIGDAVGMACMVDGDGGGAALRVQISDRYGDREALTLARAIDFNGTQRRDVRIPLTLQAPLTVQAIYAVGTLARPAIRGAGTVALHDCTLTVPGSSTPPPGAPRAF